MQLDMRCGSTYAEQGVCAFPCALSRQQCRVAVMNRAFWRRFEKECGEADSAALLLRCFKKF